MPGWWGHGGLQYQSSHRERWQWRFNCPQHWAQFMENRKLLFKQMANLPIHNQAFNEIKQSSQGWRCVSPDHFGRHQFNCSSIFVKAVPKCLSCPLFYLPSSSLFLSFFPFWCLDHNQMDAFLPWLPMPLLLNCKSNWGNLVKLEAYGIMLRETWVWISAPLLSECFLSHKMVISDRYLIALLWSLKM